MSRIREIVENIKDSLHFRGDILYDVSMAERTTMKVGGNADVLVVPFDEESAVYAAWVCRRSGLELFVLGGGSNIIVRDDGLRQVVLSMERVSSLSVSGSLVTAGAGALMDSVTSFCASQCISGLSCFSGLPGTVGGGLFMNARCYDKNISDVLVSCDYVKIDDLDQCQDFSIANLKKTYHNIGDDWDYKKSPFMSFNSIILSAVLKGERLDSSEENVQALLKSNSYYIEDRRAKGHFKAPSAGSVFKNNRSFGKPSGKLIDEAGLKGVSVGGACVAPWHGNFIINNGGATASDIEALVSLVKRTVKEKSGFLLDCEIIFI